MGANTVTYGQGVITVVPGSTFDTDFVIVPTSLLEPLGGVFLKAIKFYAANSNDVLLVRNKSASGPIIAKMVDKQVDQSFDHTENTIWYPYIKASENVWSNPSNALIIFIFDTH